MAPKKQSKGSKESEISLKIKERTTLGKLRIEAGLTYRDVAELFKRKAITISHSAVHDWEHGDRRITEKNFGTLLGFYAAHLSLKIDDLYRKIGRTPPRVKAAIRKNPETMDAILKLDELPAHFRKEIYRTIDKKHAHYKKSGIKG